MKKIKRIVIIALLGAAMLWLAGNDLPKLPWPLFRQAQEDAEPVAPDTGNRLRDSLLFRFEPQALSLKLNAFAICGGVQRYRNYIDFTEIIDT